MISYSLVSNTSASLGIIDRQALMEQKLEEFWSSPYEIDQIDEYCRLVCEGDLLLEFSLKDFVMDNLANVLQFGIGAALEGGITIGTLGVGTGAGVAAEAINDLIFFGYSVGDFIVSAKGIFSDLMELKDLLVEIFSTSIEDEPQVIYDVVQEAIAGAGDLINRLGFDFDEMMEKITNAFQKLLKKIAKPAGDMIAVFSPFPGTDAAVQTFLSEFADDAFKLFIEKYNSIPGWFKDLLHDPSALLDFVQDGINATVDYLDDIYTQNKRGGEGFLKKLAKTVTQSHPLIMLANKTGALEKIIKFLREKANAAAEYGVKTIEKIYPIMMSGLSALTVITTQDY